MAATLNITLNGNVSETAPGQEFRLMFNVILRIEYGAVRVSYYGLFTLAYGLFTLACRGQCVQNDYARH